MKNQEQSIPCPVCQTKIPFDAKQLLMGTQYTCPNCQAVIGLASESKPIVEEAIEKFESLKGEFKSNKKK